MSCILRCVLYIVNAVLHISLVHISKERYTVAVFYYKPNCIIAIRFVETFCQTFRFYLCFNEVNYFFFNRIDIAAESVHRYFLNDIK